MEMMSGSRTNNTHFTRYGAVGLEFNRQAVEILLLDRRGRVVWQKQRAEPLEILRWEGLDLHGDPVTVGTYTCKISYLGKPPLYLPFVFIR